MKKFNIASASVIGSEHVRLNLNNQDSLLVTEDRNYLMGVVSDGCGSCKHSEVGSNLIVRLVSKHISMSLRRAKICDVKQSIDYARINIVSALGNIVSELADEFTDLVEVKETSNGLRIQYEEEILIKSRVNMVSKYLLSTVVGFYMNNEYTVIFSIGDGFYAVNEEITCLETEDEAKNAPAYLAYNLIPNVLENMRPEALQFSVKLFDTSYVDTLMIGTDGLRFMQEGGEQDVPGKFRKVGPLSQLWDDRMFVNSDIMRRTLSMLNKEVHVPDWVGQSIIPCASILKDDVAVISARRIK